ncbi:MAG TPA: hypothetical protein VF613_22275 [Longimicrobium sp.]
MALATRHRTDPAPRLTPVPGLIIRREHDPAVMAALQGRTELEMERRFRAGHHAYVAVLHGAAAAWGWAATRTAEIGELASTVVIPDDERYLWNFVTLKAFRGMGIYPRLLDGIVEAEPARRFWIAYAPENHASGAGIRRAGFTDVAELSFDTEGRPAVKSGRSDGTGAARMLGLPEAEGPLAPCWRCARAAGVAASSCASGQCCCDYQRAEAGCETEAVIVP